MNSTVATLICASGIAGLLYLDRDKTAHVSRALWLPGIWIAIVGSRPVSQWLGISPPSDARVDGSPVDAAAFAVLLVIAIGVLVRRRSRARTLLLANWPILIYFLYCLVSVAWSYHPDVTFKRWIKAVGDLAMALVIATDGAPVAAVTRLVSRIGMILFPVSVLFIRYYDDLGRGYTSDGLRVNTGVTTNKNSLGIIVLVISLLLLWNVRALLIHKAQSNRGRRLVAQGTLLVLGLALLWSANCSTGIACFALGAFLIIALNLRMIRRRPARVHGLCLTILLAGAGALLLGGQADVASALGRQSDLSGRTAIWAAVISAAPNSVVGAGFESFWASPNVRIFQQTLSKAGWYKALVADLNEAHNGYIETYLNLGWIGVCLIALVLIGGYRRALKAFERDPELGSLFLAYIAIVAIYNITEAGFRMLNPAWIFLLVAIVAATGVSTGMFGGEQHRTPASRLGKLNRPPGFNELIPEPDNVHAAWQTELHLHRDRVARASDPQI
jgi:exopolysaccharide production protein ExoQ